MTSGENTPEQTLVAWRTAEAELREQARGYHSEERISRWLGCVLFGIGMPLVALGAAKNIPGEAITGGGFLMVSAINLTLASRRGHEGDVIDAELLARERISLSPTSIPQLPPSGEV